MIKNFKSIERTVFLTVFAAFSGLLLLMIGCMETTTPEAVNTYNLNVRAYQVDPANPDVKIPLRGVDIQVTDLSDENSTPSQSLTNDQGLATFEMNVPLIGSNVRITANYNNQVQSKSNVLLCQDTLVIFIFDTTTVDAVECGNLDGRDTLVFIDETGSPELSQNSPAGINQYERCWSLTNSPNNTETVTATIPDVQPPFSIAGLYLDGLPLPPGTTTVDLEPGSSITLCFNVSTEQAGVFTADLTIPLTCPNAQGSFILTLQAEVVEPGCTCEELEASIDIQLPERVEVGQSIEYTETVFTNNLACAVTVSQPNIENSAEWQLVSPTFPQTIGIGQSLSITIRFTPGSAGESMGMLNLTITPEGSAEPCDFNVNYTANGCNNSCPYISKNRVDYAIFGPNMIVDTVSNRTDNRVFVTSAGNIIFNENSTASEVYYILNPDSACSDINVSVNVFPADNHAAEYFTVNPQSLNLAPGEFGAIEVTFTAPSIEEFEQIVAERGNTGRLTDSLFKVRVQFQSPGCQQEIEANAVVTIFPDISPIINLRAYNQRTVQKPEAENEVYIFGNYARSILKGPGGSPGPYPPDLGDIYIDVDDNDPSASPPQPPILKLVNNAIGMKVWRNGYSESAFSDVPSLYLDFIGDPNYSTGYSPDPITGLQVGDVIAIQFNQSVYGLIYIRRVDDGTEQTSSKQSGIEFRAVFPLYI